MITGKSTQVLAPIKHAWGKLFHWDIYIRSWNICHLIGNSEKCQWFPQLSCQSNQRPIESLCKRCRGFELGWNKVFILITCNSMRLNNANEVSFEKIIITFGPRLFTALYFLVYLFHRSSRGENREGTGCQRNFFFGPFARPHAPRRAFHWLCSPFPSGGLKNRETVNSLQWTHEAPDRPLTSEAWWFPGLLVSDCKLRTG